MSDISPINYYGLIPEFRKEALQETQNQVGQQQLAGMRQDQARQGRQDERNQQFQADFQEAYHSDDPKAMQALAAKYPEQAQALTQAVGFQNADQAQQVSNAANDLMVADRTGSPEAMAAAIARNAAAIQTTGTTPQELMQLHVSNPDQFRAVLGAVRMSSLNPQQQYAVEDAQQGRSLQAQQLAETIRSNSVSDAQGWARIGLQQQGLENDKEMRKLAKEQQAYQRQLDAETSVLRQQKIQQDLDANKQKMADAAQSKQLGSGYALEAAEMANRLASDPNLGSITGNVTSRIPTLRGSSQDLINDASRLQSLLTQDNLKLMTGVLTDRDIQFLGRISSGLNIGEDGIKGSEQAVRNQMRSISNKLVSGLKDKGYVAQDYQLGGSSSSGNRQGQQPDQQIAPQAVQPQQQQVAPAPANNNFSTLWGG